LFQNSEIWPVSFKAVKKKLKEYGKKSRKDTRLKILEYKSESGSEEDKEKKEVPTPDPQLSTKYQLPKLKPPLSYHECVHAFHKINHKI
jgi:hypothetical protein